MEREFLAVKPSEDIPIIDIVLSPIDTWRAGEIVRTCMTLREPRKPHAAAVMGVGTSIHLR